jgi:hypothetical protein
MENINQLKISGTIAESKQLTTKDGRKMIKFMLCSKFVMAPVVYVGENAHKFRNGDLAIVDGSLSYNKQIRGLSVWANAIAYHGAVPKTDTKQAPAPKPAKAAPQTAENNKDEPVDNGNIPEEEPQGGSDDDSPDDPGEEGGDACGGVNDDEPPF